MFTSVFHRVVVMMPSKRLNLRPIAVFAVMGVAGLASVSWAQEPSPDTSSTYDDSMDSAYDSSYGADYEAQMNGGYGSGGGGYGGGGSVETDVSRTYLADLISLTDGFKLGPLFAPENPVEVQSGPALGRDSEVAFQSGNPAIALEMMCGHMTTEYEDAIEVLRSAKFSMTLRRPVWMLRWGISIAIRGDEDVESPSPIRAGATTPGRRLAGSSDGGYPDATSSYSDSGMMDSMESSYSMDEGMGGLNSRPKPVTQKVRDMLDKEAETLMDENLGLVATIVGEEFTKRFTAGDFGPLFIGITPPAPVDPRAPALGRTATVTSTADGKLNPGAAGATGAVQPTPKPGPGSISAALEETLSSAPDALTMWIPGLSFVGSGPYEEMMPVAKRDGLDYLLHFDVLLKPGRGDQSQNLSRCRLFNVATGKQLAVSKSIDSLEAAQWVATGRAADEGAYINDQMANLFGLLDRETKLIPMPPALNAESARRRVAMLIGGPNAKTLRTLAEIRLYQALGLLTEPEVEMAFDIVGGVDALLFLHGPRQDRLAMAHKWAIPPQTPPKK